MSSLTEHGETFLMMLVKLLRHIICFPKPLEGFVGPVGFGREMRRGCGCPAFDDEDDGAGEEDEEEGG